MLTEAQKLSIRNAIKLTVEIAYPNLMSAPLQNLDETEKDKRRKVESQIERIVGEIDQKEKMDQQGLMDALQSSRRPLHNSSEISPVSAPTDKSNSVSTTESPVNIAKGGDSPL